jgi:hypothetical protein
MFRSYDHLQVIRPKHVAVTEQNIRFKVLNNYLQKQDRQKYASYKRVIQSHVNKVKYVNLSVVIRTLCYVIRSAKEKLSGRLINEAVHHEDVWESG